MVWFEEDIFPLASLPGKGGLGVSSLFFICLRKKWGGWVMRHFLVLVLIPAHTKRFVFSCTQYFDSRREGFKKKANYSLLLDKGR